MFQILSTGQIPEVLREGLRGVLETSLIFALLCAIVGVIACMLYWTIRNGISPMPTARKVRRALFEHMPEGMRGTIAELGSGWGTLALPIAQKYPHSSVIGYETNPIAYLFSTLFCRCPNLHFERRDFFTVPLEGVSCIVCYLYPGAMQALADKCRRELQPGAYIISHTFALPGFVAEKVIEVPDLYKTRIYIYRAKVCK